MIHYTCDQCGKKIGHERYTVRIEVQAAFDPDELTPQHLEEDHLAAIAAEIEALDSTSEFSLEDPAYKSFQFDLCETCCQTYVKAPLPRTLATRPKFSHN
jgi:hypothetical protein